MSIKFLYNNHLISEYDEFINQVSKIESSYFQTPFTDQEFHSFYNRSDVLFAIALDNSNNVVAYVVVQLLVEQSEVITCATLSERQGKGIGRQIYEFTIERLAEKNINQCFLEVRESNKRAISLYSSLGFKQISTRKNYYKNPPEDALIMKLNI